MNPDILHLVRHYLIRVDLLLTAAVVRNDLRYLRYPEIFPNVVRRESRVGGPVCTTSTVEAEERHDMSIYREKLNGENNLKLGRGW